MAAEEPLVETVFFTPSGSEDIFPPTEANKIQDVVPRARNNPAMIRFLVGIKANSSSTPY